MTEHQRLIDQLIRHEGIRLKPYVDLAGKMTIGVGRNLTDVGISHGEAMQLLENDIHAAEMDLVTFPWFGKLDDIRRRALIDMRFNLGPTRFREFHRMLRALDEQDYSGAAQAMRESLWYRQVKRRGVELVHMMATGEEAA